MQYFKKKQGLHFLQLLVVPFTGIIYPGLPSCRVGKHRAENGLRPGDTVLWLPNVSRLKAGECLPCFRQGAGQAHVQVKSVLLPLQRCL